MASISSTAPTSDVPSTNSLANPKSQLKSEDFIKLLITQLQNQDPTKPMDNAQMLQQVSQIGQLQSQNSLQTTLEGITLQNSISSASSMIGKKVTGLAANGEELKGIVTSIKVVDKKVTLELDNGKKLDLANVTGVASEAPAN